MFMSGVFSWNFCTNYKTTGDMDIAVSPSLMGYRDQVREKKIPFWRTEYFHKLLS